MIWNFFIAVALTLTGASAFAHDSGHGPKVMAQGKFGGKLSAVILKKEANNSSAKAYYAAELTKAADGKLRLYFYDTKMASATPTITVISGLANYKSKTAKKSVTEKVDFKKEGENYEAQLPADVDGSVSVEVVMMTPDGELMAAFPRMR
jgi:hypothetical protein